MPTLGDPKDIQFATAGKQDGQVLDVACMVAGGPHAPDHASVALDALVETDSGAGPRDRALDRHMAVLARFCFSILFCLAMTRHNFKSNKKYINKVEGFGSVQLVRVTFVAHSKSFN